MTDLVFKIPLPQGTRFLEAGAGPATEVSFDGNEITFFTASDQQRIRNAYFILEVTDPSQTTFTTYAWIAWNGDLPGEYVTEETVVDTTLRPLPWDRPARSRVQLEVGATATNDIITYTIYPVNVTTQRIWDFKVNFPLPKGTSFLSAEAPPSFTSGFNGRVVSFSTLELPSQTKVGPLQLKVSSQRVEAAYIKTRASASWKNVGRLVGRQVPFQEDTSSGDIVIQPHRVQQVVPDLRGDVPFSNYDLVSVALSHTGTHLEIIYYTAGEVGPAGLPLEYIIYIDQDCRADTGLADDGLGIDFRVRYRQATEKIYLHARNETNEGWDRIKSAEVAHTVQGNQVIVSLPDSVLAQSRRFCWSAQAKNRTTGFVSNLPADGVPDWEGFEFSLYEAVDGADTVKTEDLQTP